ncbi:MAG: YlbF family regulator [Bacilli bacterium]|nr:YlbF family regulator [Bacilli bacterium]
MEEKVDKLIKSIAESNTIKDIRESIHAIKENHELMDKLTKYNETYDENLKKEILEYKEMINYRHNENELNYLILEINKRLKEITNESN